MNPSYDGDRSAAMISRSLAEAKVNQYEVEHASVMEEEAA